MEEGGEEEAGSGGRDRGQVGAGVEARRGRGGGGDGSAVRRDGVGQVLGTTLRCVLFKP